MTSSESSNERSALLRAADFPALTKLRLHDADFAALARQGFVAVERRGEQTYFKLRFRRDGRQRVRYIGGPDQARAVEAELAVLQTDLRMRRRLAILCQLASQSMRNAKQNLEPLLEARGLHFHGRAIRQRRGLN
jgi:hypothetical protein